MTVKELINKLEKCNMDADVYIGSGANKDDGESITSVEVIVSSNYYKEGVYIGIE